jgi:hypothetical protein
MEDNETEIENSTCTSLTMRAGIWDLSHEQNPEIPTNAVTVQGEAGTGWGQTWSVTAGAAVQDHTFTLQPGLVQIAVSDGLVVLINGEVTCATPDGRLP